MSSTNIMILEARNPLEHQIIENPNVAGAVAGLTAPQQPGETVQAYDQQHTAGEQLHRTPTPAFFRQAGEQLNKLVEQLAPPKLKKEVKTKKVASREDLPPRSLERIQLADMLKDRIAYQ